MKRGGAWAGALSRRRRWIGILAALTALGLSAGCGQKGPPLPPLVLIPAAPADLIAERRGATVDIRFNVPSANTDGSRPANVARVDVYALTGPATVTENEVLKQGRLIASVQVKAPRDPDETIDAEDPASDLEPLEGPGLDQGAAARVSEQLEAAALVAGDGRPIGAKPQAVVARSYIGISITARGRLGSLSKRAAVPFVVSPPAPMAPVVTYDERAVTIGWVAEPESALPAAPAPRPAYHVYEVRNAAGSGPTGAPAAGPPPSNSRADVEIRLTTKPVTDLMYEDRRVEWGVRRCYTVRVVESIDGLTVESDAPPPACTTLVDTFAPPPPSGLEPIASDGAISLIWDPGEAPDLAGYVVLRGPAGGGELTPITLSPIAEASFRDVVPSGGRFVYAVQAVDKAGNRSAPSDRVEETSR